MNLEEDQVSSSEKLIALIDHSENNDERLSYINILGSLNIKTFRMYEYLENLLLSDSSVFVRADAAKWLILNFKDKGKTPLLWSVQHEKSAYFFKILLDFIEGKNESFSELLEKEILKRFSHTYDLYEEEARFIFDVEYQKDMELGELVKYISQDPVEVRLYQKRNGRIIALNLSSKHIPESIVNLSELKSLNLHQNSLKSLPESIRKLKNLIKIDLSSNRFETLPNWLSDLPNLKRINLYSNRLKSAPDCVVKIAKEHYAPLHIKQGVIPSEALILGILDILLGSNFIKLSNNKQFLHPSKGGYSHCYKMNDEGYITALYFNHKEPIFLLEFPEQISDLQYLEELYIQYHKIAKFPESIIRLKNLKIFDFKSYPNITRNIPKSVVPFLLNLEKFECDEYILKELSDIKNTQDIRDINIEYRNWDKFHPNSPAMKKVKTKNSIYDILVVGDIQIIRLLQNFFKGKGLISKGAVSGLNCFKKLDQHKPKVILLDVILPDMSGYLVCKKIRENELYKDLLIYILTARPKYEVEMKVKECGADGYILKPFDFADFDIVLESLKD